MGAMAEDTRSHAVQGAAVQGAAAHDAEIHEDHGHSVAAWTCVGILMIAALLISIGVAFGNHVLDIIGVVLIFVGVAAGIVLSKAGFGSVSPPERQSETHESV